MLEKSEGCVDLFSVVDVVCNHLSILCGLSDHKKNEL